jgi:serine/threonine protein kinase
MACEKHPLASPRGGWCPVCLLEEALLPDKVESPRRLVVQLPLGLTSSGSVFLVRQEAPAAGLLRLKIWHRQATPDFLDRFNELRQALAQAAETEIVAPIAGSLDTDGCPSVLTEFRRGVPLLQAVASGALSRRAAADLAGPVREVLGRMHARRLAHGSIVAGNLIVRPDLTAISLLDFGLSALQHPPSSPAAAASEDDEALDALIWSL